jgi:hypothetical protein
MYIYIERDIYSYIYIISYVHRKRDAYDPRYDDDTRTLDEVKFINM